MKQSKFTREGNFKKNGLALQGLKILTLVLMIFISNCIISKAQSNHLFIQPSNKTIDSLNTEQLLRYYKIHDNTHYSNHQLINVGSLNESLIDGKMELSFSQNPCNNSVFVQNNSEYNSEQEYYWFGDLQISETDSTTHCTSGTAMFLSNNNELFGQIEIEGTAYEINDLSGGVQLISVVEKAPSDQQLCSIAEGQVLEKTTQTTSSEFCKIRVLFLYTQGAKDQEVNINNRIQLAKYQTSQALINSQASVQWEVVGIAQVNYSESVYNSNNTNGTGLHADLNNITYGAISSNINTLKSQYAADLVVLFVKGSLDNTKGIAYLWQNNNPYLGRCVVQTSWATNNGYSFAHEFGHLLGALHQEGEPGDPFPTDKGHAHRFSYYTGWWFFQKKNYAKTIVYGGTAGDDEVILNYSNPHVSYYETATGIANQRDAVSNFQLSKCEISNYDNNNDTSFAAFITGPSKVCPDAGTQLFANYTGPNGIYNFDWYTSTNGITYSSSQSSSTSFYATVGQYTKLRVIAPSGQIKYAFHHLTAATSINGLPCALKTSPPIDYIDKLNYVLPIPTDKNISINIDFSQDCILSISLFDCLGRELKQLYNDSIIKGNNQFQFDLTSIQSGLYFIRINTSSGFIKNEKIVINH